MRLLKIAFFSLALIFVSCNTKERSKEINETEETIVKEPKFKYWNWITVGNKKSDSALTAHFNKLKRYGIDAVLINTGADPKLDSIALQHPDWYMVSRSGKSCFDERPYVGYYQWLSPTNPAARKHILSLVEGLAEVEGVTSVHLDYIRYPDVYLPIGLLPKYNLKQEEELPDYDFDYSDASVEKFMALHHKDPRKMENPMIDVEWKNFRLNEIKSLVGDAYDIVHKHNKKLSAAVFPYPEMADHMVRQRWDKWKIDMVLPMIYYNFYNEELDWIGYATKQGIEDLEGSPTELHTGLYTPKLSDADLKEAIQLAKDNGAKGVAFFDDYTLSNEQFEIIKASKE